MGQSRLNTKPRAVRVALLCAAPALLAGAAFGLALASARPSTQVSISPVGVVATRASRILATTAAQAPARQPTVSVPLTPATTPAAPAPTRVPPVPRVVFDWRASGSQGPELVTVSEL